MRIAIVGFDTEGRSSYEYFAAQGGHELTICDQKTDISVPDGANSVLGDGYLDDLDRFDLIVRTAGLPPRLILDKNPAVADKITSHVEQFFKASPTSNIIGVTGTKGKGTTSSLLAKLLETAGKMVRLGGNIGVPPLSFLGELTPDSWVVLELSSFQLSDLRYSPHIAICLMIAPEHLNWHADMAEYLAAKGNIFARQSADDVAIYYADNAYAKQLADLSPGFEIPYFAAPGAFVDEGEITIAGQPICQTNELKLPGAHNWQNACAALTAFWQVSQDAGVARAVLTSFTGLEHRLELVRELEGVRYYDDSFGTTPETAMVACQAFTAPKVLILGGSDKGAAYDDLAAAVAANTVRQVLLIGEQAPHIQAALEAVGFHGFAAGGTTMTDIVRQAKSATRPGDVVLLSPACASFDMFANYKDRGDEFKRAVRGLV